MPRTWRDQVTSDRCAVRCLAAPRKKLPSRSVDIFCANCDAQLYGYAKGGKGKLVKVYKERITENYTDGGELGPCHCPKCSKEFARETLIHGRPAYKIVGGKVYMK